MIDFVPNSKTETSNRNDLMAFLFFLLETEVGTR